MAARVLVLSGLNLDKGWPDEFPGVGPLLRAASADLLLQVAGRAFEMDLTAMVVLGGLWDASSVRSSTVDEVKAVLDAMPFPVVVLPDAAEAHLQNPPRQLVEWPASVLWIGPGEVRTIELGGTDFAFAGPLAPALRAEGTVVFTNMPQLLPTNVPVVAPPDDRPDSTLHVLEVSPLVPGSGGGTPRAQLVTWTDDRGLEAADIDFDLTVGEPRTIDVGVHEDSASLVQELDGAVAASSPLDRIIVSGRVGPRLVIPPALDWRPVRDDVTVVWRDLAYEFPTASPEDRTVAAELVRRLSGAGPDVARRHQALALGLSSLEGADAS